MMDPHAGTIVGESQRRLTGERAPRQKSPRTTLLDGAAPFDDSRPHRCLSQLNSEVIVGSPESSATIGACPALSRRPGRPQLEILPSSDFQARPRKLSFPIGRQELPKRPQQSSALARASEESPLGGILYQLRQSLAAFDRSPGP